jgi:hypothetical protein
MLSPEQLAAIDNFRFIKGMPSRAAAIRFLLGNGSCGGSVGLDTTEIQVRSHRCDSKRQTERILMSEVSKAGGTAMQKELPTYSISTL